MSEFIISDVKMELKSIKTELLVTRLFAWALLAAFLAQKFGTETAQKITGAITVITAVIMLIVEIPVLIDKVRK